MDLDDLIQSIDIVDYISQYVDLEEKCGEYWGLSPFKEEKTPSFSVRRETNSFYDFSSGIGGNVFTFTRFYHHCGGDEAIKILKKYIGDDGTSSPVKKMSATLVCKKFQHKKEQKKQRKYRKYDEKCMELYRKDDAMLDVWGREGISRSSMDKFQVYYDDFTNRLVYPIRSVSGDIINIGGRTLDPDWKDKGLRKYTYLSQWGVMDTIYGIFENMDEIKKSGEVILFEGCKSVLKADSWGIHNTGAILTSHVNPDQMKILASLGVHVVFALDKDVDILKDHNIAKLRRYVNVEYILDKDGYLDEKDSPVDKGLEVFTKLYQNRVKYR